MVYRIRWPQPAGTKAAMASQHTRDRTVRGGYLVASLLLIALYPLLPTAGRDTVVLLVSLGAIPAVVVGLRRISPGRRRPWVLLLAALAVISAAHIAALSSSGPADSVSRLLDAAGNLLGLAAALALVTQQGRNNLGRVIDTTIAALALSGLLWDAVVFPNLSSDHRTGVAKVALLLVIFALSGVLGALAQLVITRPVAALWPLTAAIALALMADIIEAVTVDPQLITVAGMVLVGAYTAAGLFGLDPTAPQLATPAPTRPDTLSLGRAVFLGVSVAIIPIVIGVRQIVGGNTDGLVLVISSATIATLVIVRISQLSAQRDQAEAALRHEATHDPLTGLPNRKAFAARLTDALQRGEGCAILFCDLDGFKSVNDRYGHAQGDQLLIEVSQRLRESVRTDDLVSRFGGDEFVILFRETAPNEVHTINRRITDALSRPFPVSGDSVTIGASTGTALAAGDVDPEELIDRADHAMYSAKNTGT